VSASPIRADALETATPHAHGSLQGRPLDAAIVEPAPAVIADQPLGADGQRVERRCLGTVRGDAEDVVGMRSGHARQRPACIDLATRCRRHLVCRLIGDNRGIYARGRDPHADFSGSLNGRGEIWSETGVVQEVVPTSKTTQPTTHGVLLALKMKFCENICFILREIAKAASFGTRKSQVQILPPRPPSTGWWN
jgi:hypothetical protein